MTSSKCRYPQHHESSGSGLAALVAAVVAAVVLAAVLKVFQAIAVAVAFLTSLLVPVVVGLAAAVVVRAVWAVWRLARMGPAARRNWHRALWARFRWRWLCRNLGLAYHDRQARRTLRLRIPFTTAVRVKPTNYHLERFPRAKFRADEWGFIAMVRTVPRSGREDFESHAQHLADAWRCVRVGVSQPEPGRVLLRGLRRDPLTEPLPASVIPRFDGRRLFLGRDEFGALRFARLDTISGAVIGGLPGRGKSVLAASFAVQLATPICRQYIADGGDGADWSPWAGRAAAFADDLAGAAGVLEVAHQEMTKRLRSVADVTGHRNAWAVGPSEAWPLCWTLIDECHRFLDLESAKALGRMAEQQVRSCRMLAAELLRRGRKVMFHTTLIASKPTAGSIPPDIRDLAGLRLSFACSTTEMAVASLGDDIRAYPSLNPVTLQDDAYIGVAVARLVTGSDLFTRLRVPYVDEGQADNAARVPVCVGCVGEGTDPAGGVCLRCHGTAIDPDPDAPVGMVVVQ